MPRPAGWPGAFDEYLTTMRAGGRSPGTVRLHRHYLAGLAGAHRSPWSVTSRDLLAHMANPAWSPETRKSARSVLRGFFRWAHGRGYLEADPALALPTVRVPAGQPRPTPELLVRQLVHHDDPRLGLMAQLAAYGGLRAGEIARVHGRDLVDDTLRVTGKGGRVRGVPVINAAMLLTLRELEGWAFPNGYGSHVTPGHVSKLLSAALPDGWTAHTLRHRAGTSAYAGTRDLLAVQALLGHSRPETTQRYVRLPDDAVRAAVAFTELAG